MSSGLKNPFGLLDNDQDSIVRVEDVPSGLGCNCFCAYCGSRFIAVHPKSRRAHFRHHQSVDCGSAFETAVHLLAKQVLVQSKQMMVPYLRVWPSRSLWRIHSTLNEEYVEERRLVTFDAVDSEVWMDGRRPDVVLTRGEQRILVEIYVTHDISDDKLKWIKERDLATVRFDLSHVEYDVTPELLKDYLHSGRLTDSLPKPNLVSWVHHPAEKAAQLRVDEAYLQSLKVASSIPPLMTTNTEEAGPAMQLSFNFAPPKWS